MPLSAEIYYFLHSTEDTSQIPVVLIHGAGGMHLYWPSEIRRLPGYRMYALDLPGHGKSPGMAQQSIPGYVAAMGNWMDQIGLEKAVFAGHSMGSAIALSMALEHPRRVQGLMLLGSGARLRVHPDILMGIADQANFNSAVKIIVEWSFSPHAPVRLVELARQRMVEIKSSILLGDMVACDGFDVTDRLSEIDCPTLVICGEEDRMTPKRYAQFLVDHIKGSRLEIIPGCGHMVMLERPVEVKDRMLKFLRLISDRESNQKKR
jgi:pimeloyl-ACP methyl ester carboxylesterase